MERKLGVLFAEVSRIEEGTQREFDKTLIKIEIVELKRFNNGYSKIKTLNISGTLDFRQMKHIENSLPKIIETNEINWF